MTRAKKKAIKFKKDKRSKTSKGNGTKGGRPIAPEYLYAATQIIHKHFLKHSEDTPDIVHWRGNWHRYGEGGWTSEAADDIRKNIMTYLQSHSDYGPYATPNYISGVVEHMKAYNLCGMHGSVNMPVWMDSRKSAFNWMGFKNGVAINVWELAKGSPATKYKKILSPDFFSQDYVDYDYNPKAKCLKFLNFLNTSLPSKDQQKVLQEMMGLMLADTCKYEVFFYLYGPTSRNGKTVALHICSSMVGKQNVSHVALNNLAERFETWPLAEAKVNIYGDMATDVGKGQLAHVEGVFKDLISGANLEYQKKGKDKYNAPCRARFVFAGNSLPTFVDRSDAIWERLRVIHFPVQISASKRDPNLADKIIQKEMSGVFNWAIRGLSRVIKQNKIMDSTEGVEIKVGHRLECDHEKMFIEEFRLRKGNGNDHISMTQLYAWYKDWMNDNGFLNKGSGKFYQRVEALVPGIVRTTKRVEGMKYPVKVFKGLKGGG